MSESSSAAENDLRIEMINHIASIVVGVIFLAVAGVAVYQFQASYKVPDRKQVWTDCWLKQLSKPSGLPEFDGAVKTPFEGIQLDTAILQPQALNVDWSSAQTKSQNSSRSRSSQSPSRSLNTSR